jgi:hypothetical protein
VRHKAGHFREEPGAGNPPARICEGEAEWRSYSTTIDAAQLVRLADRSGDNAYGRYLRSLYAEREADAVAR